MMIRTEGFQSEILRELTENIDKFIEDTAKQHGSTFRLIDIKFAAAAKPFESTGDHADINYSALIVYEV